MIDDFCDDIRIGGTLSSTGIAGGVSINDSRIIISDWSGLWGHTGLNYQRVRVAGRPGATIAGSGLALERLLAPSLTITRWNELGTRRITAPSLGAQLWDNTDLILGYLADPDGFYLELDDPDGTKRFVKAYAIEPAAIRAAEWRRLTPGLTSPWPYWRQGGNEATDTINGADTMVVGGDVTVYDAVLTFSGDGSFTHNGEGWTLAIAGSSGAVTVDLGARTVKQAGVDASNLLTRNSRDWGWFPPGNNSVTSTVSVGTVWRNQWN